MPFIKNYYALFLFTLNYKKIFIFVFTLCFTVILLFNENILCINVFDVVEPPFDFMHIPQHSECFLQKSDGGISPSSVKSLNTTNPEGTGFLKKYGPLIFITGVQILFLLAGGKPCPVVKESLSQSMIDALTDFYSNFKD